MLAFLFIAFATVAISLVQAENDWSVPCTSGGCNYTYDGDRGANKAYAHLALSGGEHLLSDITLAAGWKILDCDPTWEEGVHKVRMVCVGSPEQMALCEHIYTGGSAEHTVVRLPENCGTGPFARIVSMWEPADQSVPLDIQLQLAAANFTESVVVIGLELDYNLHEIPETQGHLSFAITASNKPHDLPPTQQSMSVAPLRGRKRALHHRGIFKSIRKSSKYLKGAAKDAASVVSHGASVISHGAHDVAHVAKKTKHFLTVEHNLTKGEHDVPIHFAKNFTVIDTTISCHDVKENFNAHIKIGVDAYVNTTMSFGVVMAGKIVPPKIEQFHAFSDMEGNAEFAIHLGLEAVGSWDSLFVSLFKIGLPGLQIPGIGVVGPNMNVGFRIQMDVNMVSQIDINAAVRMDGIHMSFPPGSGDNSAKAAPKNQTNSLKLSTVNGGLDAQGTITVSFIPRMEFGLDAKFAQALVYVDAELGAVLSMNGDAGATNTTQHATESASANVTTANVIDSSTNATGDATDSPPSLTADATTARSVDLANDSGNGTDDAILAQSDQDQTNDSVDPAGEDTADVAEEAPDNAIVTSTATASLSPVVARAFTGGGHSVFGRNKRIINLAHHYARNVIHSKRQGNDSVPDDDATVGNLPVSKPPSGCISLTAVFSVNAGLQGSMLPLFSKSFKYSIFQTSKQMFQTCFNGATPKASNPNAFVGGAAATAAVVGTDAADPSSTNDGSATGGDGIADASPDDASSDSTNPAENNGTLTRRLTPRRVTGGLPLPRKDGALGKRQSAGGMGNVGGIGGVLLTGLSNSIGGSGGSLNGSVLETAIISALVCPSKIAKLNALMPLLGVL